jgi:hypothetical protein
LENSCSFPRTFSRTPASNDCLDSERNVPDGQLL